MKLMKNVKRLLGAMLSFVMMLTLFMWNGVEAKAAIMDNIQVGNVQKHDNDFLKSFQLNFHVGYPASQTPSPEAECRVAIHTQKFNDSDLTDAGSYASNHDDLDDWVNSPLECNFLTWGSVKDSESSNGSLNFTRSETGEDQSIIVEFTNNVIDLNTTKTYYVYIWTKYSNWLGADIYPDVYVYEFTTGQGDFTGSTTQPNPNPVNPSQPGNNNQNQNTSENNKTYTHTHNFQWIVTTQPTEKTDGCNSLMCEGCGAIEATQPISYFNNITNNVMKEIKAAPEKGTVTIDDEFLRCFSNEMVEEILARPDLTVVVNFTDKGVNYSFTIPAGKAPTDGQEWYGYYYLGSVYGWTLMENAM